MNNKININNLFKITITKKILLLALGLLVFTVLITSLSSFYFFRKLLENELVKMDLKTDTIKKELRKFYSEKIDTFNLPDNKDHDDKDKDEDEDKNKDSKDSIFFKPLEKELTKYESYNFKIEFFEGTLEFESKPKLVYDDNERKYFFEISRKIKFEENKPFYDLKVSIKVEFFKIILKSLLLGALVTILLLFPAIMFFSRFILIKPILKISKGANLIASGRLGIKVKSYSSDELGELANTFNYMSKELHKIKRIRDDLLAVISHELRSPLGRIKGYTELLNDLKLNKKEQKIYFDSIFSEIDFVNYMVGEIIEISRLELNKEQLFFETIDLADLINEIEKEIKLASHINKDINYDFQYTSGLFCSVDVNKVKRVLLNIFENSKKAKATNVKFIAEKDKDKIKISIIDNGVGIPEDQLEIVFEKFYRVDKSRDRNTGGFGLGLAICRGIILEHKGSIYFVKKDIGAELKIELQAIVN